MTASLSPKTADSRDRLYLVHRLGLDSKLHILLLAAALPLCVVAGYQALSNWSTSREIAREFPIFEDAAARDAQFAIFMDGLSDAVDTGTLNVKAVEALRQATVLSEKLRQWTSEPMAELQADLEVINNTVGRSRALVAITPLSREINRASKAISSNGEFHRKRLNEFVMGSVYTSQRDAAGATLVALLSMSFAIWFGSRLIQNILDVERRAYDASALNQAIMDAAPIGLMTFGPDHRIATANRACHFMHGYEPDELLGRQAEILQAEVERDVSISSCGGDFPDLHGQLIVSERMAVSNLAENDRMHLRKDGSRFSAGVIELPLRDAQGRSLGGLRLVTDITDRKRAAAKVEHMALHDSLTGLPNRLVLQQRTDRELARARRHGGGAFALALIDLDHFKQINDTLGHAVGDDVLKIVAERLKDSVRSSDTVVRMGGDEFALLLPDITRRDEASEVGQKILGELAKVAVIDGHTLHLSGSIGLAFFPEHGGDLNALLRSADAAMYDAKSRGRDAVSLYDPMMSQNAENQSELRAELRQALALGEFVLHYQPIVEAITGEVRAFEALLRWQHPDRGMVMPDGFISLAEETGLIVPIGEWVIRRACADLARLRCSGPPDLRMTVNVSPRQFMSNGLEACVRGSLCAAGLEGSALELEITESTLMNSVNRTQEILASLRAIGVRIAIDDFGTGYSSLSYLANFPVHTLKVDRSFVRQIDGGGSAASLTGAIISMGHSLGLDVVAEGVETAEQQAHLIRLECDLLQGFKFGRPVPFEQLPVALRSGTTSASAEPTVRAMRLQDGEAAVIC